MLHYDFKMEIFKRYLQANVDKCSDVAIETFQNFLTLRSAYIQLHERYQSLKEVQKKTTKIELPSFVTRKELDIKIELAVEQKNSQYKFSSETQDLKQLQVENQELRQLIEKVGLVIIDSIPEMPVSMAEKFDALVEEIIER